ncbi:helix-turn-helix transcriptional regulator [Gaetbulibacter jejuensis]|uniref:helix-turn-helix domain-containing protein n=1 Tax=Gaetbulibacter TaxID=311207 RepID=UPI003009537A
MIDDKEKQRQILKTLGDNIKAIRLRKGFRQNEVAYRCYFDKSSYNNIERGERNITIITLHKIAKALDEPLQNFFK